MSGYPLDEFEKKLASYYKDKKCVSYVAYDRQKNVISEEVRAFVDKMDALDFKNEIKHWNSVDADDVEYKFIGMIDLKVLIITIQCLLHGWHCMLQTSGKLKWE